MSKSRDWCFTINNPDLNDELELLNLQDNSNYLIYGRELGENGTPHYQGFVRFKHPVTMQRVKNLLSRAHLETRKGTPQQAADYCKKDGDYREFGEAPISKTNDKKKMWKDIIEWAETGEIDKIKDEYPHAYFLHYRKIQDLRQRSLGILTGEFENEWWYGKTGTGKSRRLWELYPDHYGKALNKWWDGYNDEDVVAIEEMTPDAGSWMGHFLKIWADRYPFSPEIKGGTLKKIRPKKIIVLSNYSLQECFLKEQDILPLKRRFKVIEFKTFE